jgi:negative regulator of replication initiation
MTDFTQVPIDLEVNRVIEANRQSFGESKNDILRRLLLTGAHANAATEAYLTVTEIDPPRFGSRTMGHWQSGFGGEIMAATSLKDAYCKFLLMAHKHDASFLGRFAKLKAKTRMFVARDPKALYLKSPHLAADYATELTPGWFVDTNLSEAQIGQRIREASRELGLTYGKDCWVREATRTI